MHSRLHGRRRIKSVYTFYAIGLDGVREPGRAFHFMEDNDAMAVAASMAQGHSAIEVWLEDRLVGSASAASLQDRPPGLG